MGKIPRIVIIGGGTGSYVVASGLSTMPCRVSVLLTMADEGGSNRVLRDEFGLLPTSGVRQAILALSQNKTVLRELFNYRYYHGGKNLEGMTFGNLFMAAIADIMGSQKRGIEETCKLLRVKGDIIPVSYDKIRLVAKYDNGKVVIGEHNIDEPKFRLGPKITGLTTRPKARLNPDAKKAISSADLIVIGPGDFYTNTVANLAIDDLRGVVESSKAKIVFISNLMNSPTEAPDYKLSDFFEDLKKYLSLEKIDYVLINNNYNLPLGALVAYKKEAASPIVDDLQVSDVNSHVKIIRADLLSRRVAEKVKGDTMARSIVRHDPAKLAKAILRIAMEASN